MIIAKSRTRFLMLILSLILFIVISILTYRHQGFLHTLSQIDHSIARAVVPTWLENIMKPAYIFSHGLLAGLLIFVIAFFLWGFKFKIPATWILLTSLSGWLLINVLSLFFNLEVNGTKIVYPAHTTFFMTLLISYVLLIIIPEIQHNFLQFVCQTLLLLSWIGTFMMTLLAPNSNIASAIAGWFLAIAWLQFSENVYRIYAADLYRRKGFSNSWF